MDVVAWKSSPSTSKPRLSTPRGDAEEEVEANSRDELLLDAEGADGECRESLGFVRPRLGETFRRFSAELEIATA